MTRDEIKGGVLRALTDVAPEAATATLRLDLDLREQLGVGEAALQAQARHLLGRCQGPVAPAGDAAGEDTHVVAYSLKKLVAARLVEADKVGKEVFYRPTPAGEAAVQAYRAVREECLVKSLDTELNADIGELARLLRTMSGMYDQAARAASSL